jgi:hypothetical protein
MKLSVWCRLSQVEESCVGSQKNKESYPDAWYAGCHKIRNET